MQWVLRIHIIIIVYLYYSVQLQSEVLFQSIFSNHRYFFELLSAYYINKKTSENLKIERLKTKQRNNV